MFQNKTTLRDTANNFRCLLTITDYRIFTGGGDEDISVRKKETIFVGFPEDPIQDFAELHPDVTFNPGFNRRGVLEGSNENFPSIEQSQNAPIATLHLALAEMA